MMIGIAMNMPSFFERKLPVWLDPASVPAGHPQQAV